MNVNQLLEVVAEIKRRNDELQSAHPIGAIEWHSHESIDDGLHILAAALERMIE